MSRSCQSGTFSSAAMALPRTTRARPLSFSPVIGLRLCGMAELPFCPAEKYSSTSSTSVRWRWRNSVAQRSMLRRDEREDRLELRVPVALDDLRAERRRLQAEPLADALLHARIEVRVRADRAAQFAHADARLQPRASRSTARPNSSHISASLSPKVIGSAWMPWLRPIIGVILNSMRAARDDFAQVRAGPSATGRTPRPSAPPAWCRARRRRSSPGASSAQAGPT